jgi:hypothetical protein
MKSIDMFGFISLSEKKAKSDRMKFFYLEIFYSHNSENNNEKITKILLSGSLR